LFHFLVKAVARNAFVNSANNRPHVFSNSIVHDMAGGKQGTIEYIVGSEITVSKAKNGTLQVVSEFV